MIKIHHLACGSFCPIGGAHILGRSEKMVCHCLLIETANDGLVLVDTGFGIQDAHDLSRSLDLGLRMLGRPRVTLETTAHAQIRALGLNPDDVRHILLTHLDMDHAGGIADFPKAAIHVLKAEHTAATHLPLRGMDKKRYKPVQWEHAPKWELYEATTGDGWYGFECVRQLRGLPPEILLVPLLGHTPGHTAVAVQSGTGWLLHCGDAYYQHSSIHQPDPYVSPMIALFEKIAAKDDLSRRQNQVRLRELVARSSSEVTVFCAHDADELATLKT